MAGTARGPRLSRDAVRFIIAGVLNTALTLLVYQALLFFMRPSLAYAGAWLAGLVYVAIVYPDKVFEGGRRSLTDRLTVAISYIGVFLLGLLLLSLAQSAGVPASLAIFLVIAATTVINFVASRFILRRR